MYDELDSSRFLRTLCMCLRRYGLAETAGSHLGDLRAEEQDQRAVVNPYDDQDEGTRRARRAVAQPRGKGPTNLPAVSSAAVISAVRNRGARLPTIRQRQLTSTVS